MASRDIYYRQCIIHNIHYFELCADIYFTFACHLHSRIVHGTSTLYITFVTCSNFAVYRTEPYGFVFTAIFVHHALSSMVSYVYQLIPMRAITLPSSWYIVIVLLKNSHPPRMVRLTFSNPNIWCVKGLKTSTM